MKVSELHDGEMVILRATGHDGETTEIPFLFKGLIPPADAVLRRARKPWDPDEKWFLEQDDFALFDSPYYTTDAIFAVRNDALYDFSGIPIEILLKLKGWP